MKRCVQRSISFSLDPARNHPGGERSKERDQKARVSVSEILK